MKSVTLRRLDDSPRDYGMEYLVHEGGTVTILGDEQKPDTSETERLRLNLELCEKNRDEARKSAEKWQDKYHSADAKFMTSTFEIERLNAKVTRLQNAIDLTEAANRIGNSGHKRAFNELELAFNRMREFLYPETVGENGQ
jgi:hypothetical protein